MSWKCITISGYGTFFFYFVHPWIVIVFMDTTDTLTEGTLVGSMYMLYWVAMGTNMYSMHERLSQTTNRFSVPLLVRTNHVDCRHYRVDDDYSVTICEREEVSPVHSKSCSYFVTGAFLTLGPKCRAFLL